MRLIKMTGGLGNQMFIYAFYLRMKKRHTNTRIDLSDMMHYNVHHGYEMHRVFNLPKTEFCINQPLKKVIEFLFFKKIYERKQDPSSLLPFDKKYLWPLLYFVISRYFITNCISDTILNHLRLTQQSCNKNIIKCCACI